MLNFFKKLFGSKGKIKLTMKKMNKVAYGEVEGLFEFKGEIYYKPKKGTGKNIRNHESFSDCVHTYPEYECATSKEVSDIEVTLLMPVS